MEDIKANVAMQGVELEELARHFVKSTITKPFFHAVA